VYVSWPQAASCRKKRRLPNAQENVTEALAAGRNLPEVGPLNADDVGGGSQSDGELVLSTLLAMGTQRAIEHHFCRECLLKGGSCRRLRMFAQWVLTKCGLLRHSAMWREVERWANGCLGPSRSHPTTGRYVRPSQAVVTQICKELKLAPDCLDWVVYEVVNQPRIDAFNLAASKKGVNGVPLVHIVGYHATNLAAAEAICLREGFVRKRGDLVGRAALTKTGPVQSFGQGNYFTDSASPNILLTSGPYLKEDCNGISRILRCAVLVGESSLRGRSDMMDCPVGYDHLVGVGSPPFIVSMHDERAVVKHVVFMGRGVRKLDADGSLTAPTDAPDGKAVEEWECHLNELVVLGDFLPHCRI
jgi:hypothetical protein